MHNSQHLLDLDQHDERGDSSSSCQIWVINKLVTSFDENSAALTPLSPAYKTIKNTNTRARVHRNNIVSVRSVRERHVERRVEWGGNECSNTIATLAALWHLIGVDKLGRSINMI